MISPKLDIKDQDFRNWAGADKITAALVFTDIVDSTLLLRRLGNAEWDKVLDIHFTQLNQLAEDSQGYMIKTIGDAAMVAFHSADAALDFALALNLNTGDRRVRVRVGIDVGLGRVTDHDLHGIMVHRASRIVSMAKANETWVSREVKSHIDEEKAPQHLNLLWTLHTGCKLKGFKGSYSLWSVVKA